MSEHSAVSIGVFVDGGYYAKMNEELVRQRGRRISLGALMDFVRSEVAGLESRDGRFCQITECHYFRGRFRAADAKAKNLLFAEREFEDTLIENDVIFHYKHLREIDGDIVEKGIDVWFALEAYELSTIRRFDYVVLITGDADHEMLVKKLKALKTSVVLLTGNFGRSSSTSRFLKEEVNLHVDLKERLDRDGSLAGRILEQA